MNTIFNAENYRIEDVETARINGVERKIFKAFEKKDGAFVFAGEFSAPVRTANRNLWEIVRDAV